MVDINTAAASVVAGIKEPSTRKGGLRSVQRFAKQSREHRVALVDAGYFDLLDLIDWFSEDVNMMLFGAVFFDLHEAFVELECDSDFDFGEVESFSDNPAFMSEAAAFDAWNSGVFSDDSGESDSAESATSSSDSGDSPPSGGGDTGCLPDPSIGSGESSTPLSGGGGFDSGGSFGGGGGGFDSGSSGGGGGGGMD